MADDLNVAEVDIPLVDRLTQYVAYLNFRGTSTINVTAGRVTGLTTHIDDLESRGAYIGHATATRDKVASLHQEEQKGYRAVAQKMVAAYIKRNSRKAISN
jgi:hypothetical protein